MLSILLILTVIATGFAAFTTADMKASQATYQESEAYFMAEAGLNYATFLLKHSMLVYPCPPATWVDGRTNNDYDVTICAAASGSGAETSGLPSGTYSSNPSYGPGYIVNIANGQEFVVISTEDYSQANDVYGAVNYCGSFKLSMTMNTPTSSVSYYMPYPYAVNAAPTSILFQSTGYVKQVSGAFTNIANFTIVAQRTLQCTVNLLTGYTGASNLNASSSQTINQSLEVVDFNEKFR